VIRPKSEIKLQQKEIKSRGEGTAGARPGGAGKPVQQPAQPGQPAARAERGAPVKPKETIKPPER